MSLPISLFCQIFSRGGVVFSPRLVFCLYYFYPQTKNLFFIYLGLRVYGLLPGEGGAAVQLAGSLPESSAAVEILWRQSPKPSGASGQGE